MNEDTSLREKALRATKGPWFARGRYIGTKNHMSFVGECRDINGNWCDDVMASANAAYIAAADPQTILALLDRIEALEAALQPFAQAALVIRTTERATGQQFADGDAFKSGLAWQKDGVSQTITYGHFRDARAALAAQGQPVATDGNRPLPYDRETLGRFVREAWVRWAASQPDPKLSWLMTYDELSEADKEADRQIGEAVARWTLIGDAACSALTAPAQPVGVPDESVLHQCLKTVRAHLIRLAWEENSLMIEGIDKALAAAPQPPAEGGWLPIESAPRDGTKIIGLVHAYGVEGAEYLPIVIWWLIDEWVNDKEENVWPPKLWMPLPPAPANGGEQNAKGGKA